VTESQDLNVKRRTATEGGQEGREQGGEYACGRESTEDEQSPFHRSEVDFREPQEFRYEVELQPSFGQQTREFFIRRYDGSWRCEFSLAKLCGEEIHCEFSVFHFLEMDSELAAAFI
jgi:hypothetical protein